MHSYSFYSIHPSKQASKQATNQQTTYLLITSQLVYLPAHVAIHPFIREHLQRGVPLFTFLLTTVAAAIKYLANKTLINCLSAGKRLRVKECVCVLVVLGVWAGGCGSV